MQNLKKNLIDCNKIWKRDNSFLNNNFKNKNIYISIRKFNIDKIKNKINQINKIDQIKNKNINI